MMTYTMDIAGLKRDLPLCRGERTSCTSARSSCSGMWS